jgi:tRNA(adenine34) deaminase
MEVRRTDQQWLDLALKEADEAYSRGDWPVAALVVKDDCAIATGQDRPNTEMGTTRARKRSD